MVLKKKTKRLCLLSLYFLFALSLLGLKSPDYANANTYNLNMVITDGATGDYGTVKFDNTDTGGDMEITITPGPDLGNSDNLTLNKFYFNTTDNLTGLHLTDQTSGYSLSYDFDNNDTYYKPDGDGFFDGVINFYSLVIGDSGSVTFSLSNPGGLDINDFLSGSVDGNKGSFYVATEWDASTTTDGTKFVGSPVPIPGTIVLLGSGILGLIGFRRKIRI